MRFDGLDLNLLVAFDALLDTRSVTDAAQRLKLAQPTVSAALARLRDYFKDDLLTQIGRTMIPTAKAEALAPSVKEMLNLVRFGITQADSFIPETSQRQFRIVASDYALNVLFSQVLAAAARAAPQVTFDISPNGPDSMRHFIDGDIDLFLTVAEYVLPDHPSAKLFEDKSAVICWNQGVYAKGITETQFLRADHAKAVFGEQRLPSAVDRQFEEKGIERRIAVQVPEFSALPPAIIGTDRIAVMQERHARQIAALYPITLHTLPVAMPTIAEFVQWHRLRKNDSGARWLLDLLLDQARQLA